MALAAGGGVVAGELWIPGKKIIFLPTWSEILRITPIGISPLYFAIDWAVPGSDFTVLHRWIDDEMIRVTGIETLEETP